MKRALVVALAAAAVAAASFVSQVFATPSLRQSATQLFAPPREQVHYGHIRSLRRSGSRYVLRFDPAIWLGGTTANRAAVEDGVIEPGQTVPNDYYVRDEARRVLTYLVPPRARVTILTGGPKSTRITVAELARIVQGRNPRRRALYDPGNHLGYWIRVASDTVRSLDQQYQP